MSIFLSNFLYTGEGLKPPVVGDEVATAKRPNHHKCAMYSEAANRYRYRNFKDLKRAVQQVTA
jgi:hypothetical protein